MVKCSKKEYCEAQGGNVFECSDNEGCKLDNGTCKLNEDKNLPNTLFNGGFGYGKVCVPKIMTDFVIMLVYPPAYIFFYQKKRGFKDITMIITSFILTSCFYFPGLIHAMYMRQTGDSACAGLFSDKKSKADMGLGIGSKVGKPLQSGVEKTGEGVQTGLKETGSGLKTGYEKTEDAFS